MAYKIKKSKKTKEIKDIKRQIKYFTLRHNQAKSLSEKLDYSKRIFYWETRLREERNN